MQVAQMESNLLFYLLSASPWIVLKMSSTSFAVEQTQLELPDEVPCLLVLRQGSPHPLPMRMAFQRSQWYSSAYVDRIQGTFRALATANTEGIAAGPASMLVQSAPYAHRLFLAFE